MTSRASFWVLQSNFNYSTVIQTYSAMVASHRFPHRDTLQDINPVCVPRCILSDRECANAVR